MKLDDLYRHIWAALAPGEFAEIDWLAAPRGPDWIFGLIEDLELAPGARVLDLGCGPGDQAVELAQRYRARIVALDPVIAQLREARSAARREGLAVHVAAATMEAIPAADGSVDLVWLRDALMHTREPRITLLECWRVLRPGGHLLLHSAYATELLADHELELLEAEMHVRRQGLDAERVDRALASAGFETLRSEILGSELAEHYELEDGLGSRALLRLARLEREPETARRQLGEERYRTARGLYHWVVFELLGKLSYRTSLLRRPA